MTNQYLQSAIATAPAGTSGLVVAPWDADEVYGVAANWSQAASPVLVFGDGGWFASGRQVADYSHDTIAALRDQIVESIEASGDEPDETEVDAAISFAVEF